MNTESINRARQSIREDFEKLASKIEPTLKQTQAISASHTKIQDLLWNSKEIVIENTFLTGSYQRDTMIAPLEDVDFMAQFDYSAHRNWTPRQFLQKIASILRGAYPYSTIKISPPSVTIKFAYCHFEVVPSFGVQGSDVKFWIPTGDGNGWQLTYPTIPDKWMTDQNKMAGGLFKPTIKILKHWKRIKQVPIRSFHLEMIAREAFATYEVNDLADGAVAFFLTGSNIFENSTGPVFLEPGRSDAWVDEYLFSEVNVRSRIRSAFSIAMTAATKGRQFMFEGKLSASRQSWRSVLGDTFQGFPALALSLPGSMANFELKPTLLAQGLEKKNLLAEELARSLTAQKQIEEEIRQKQLSDMMDRFLKG